MTDLQNYEQWTRDQAEAAGLHLTGAIEPIKVVPSATVLRVETDQGALFFKAPMDSFAFEARLTASLAQWFPAKLPRVVAIDDIRGWMLIGDAGTTLKQMSQSQFEIDRWNTMLREFAALQQAVTEHVPLLLKMGVPDRRLAQLPDQLEALLNAEDRDAALMLDHEDGVPAAALPELQAFVTTMRGLCAELATFNIPETLHHDDFHVGNVTLQNDQIVFIDWGESAIAHPFFSLMLALRYAKLVFNVDDAQLHQMRDAYLQTWTTYAPLADLQRAFEIAAQLGAFCRALTWLQVWRNVKPEEKGEYADAAPYWLLTCLRNTPLQA
jgi:aminoglycoside/choline kinase family phosphotransferase